MKTPRIAIFNNWWPFHIGDKFGDPKIDEPSSWAKFMEAPHFKEMGTSPSSGEKYYVIEDSRASDEIHRLVKFQTCPICREKMVSISNEEDEILLLCMRCGYWSGRGFREQNWHQSLIPSRAVFSRYKSIEPIDKASTEYLVTHLYRSPKDMLSISPMRAEKFVIDLLSDYLDCEVKALGGSKDGGIDGYILRGDKIRSIIQIKWRKDINRAEGVSIVREVGGTLLARGVPNGILVSNRVRFSKAASAEAEAISRLHISELGKIQLTLYDYHTIIDMLEIANTKLTTNMTIADWIKIQTDIVYEGASMISESLVKKYL